MFKKYVKFSDSSTLPNISRCIPSFHEPLISIRLLSIRKYSFSSKICFNKKFTRFTFQFKNLSLLYIIADIKTSLTGFIKTTDHRLTDQRPTDPPTTYHLRTDPPTHQPTIINLDWNRRPDSEHVLHSIIRENFKSCTV